MIDSKMGRTAARARALRKPKSGNSEPYRRLKPQYPNNVLIWAAKNIPHYVFTGNTIDPELKSKLLQNQLPPSIYRRILLNETIVTLDELHIIAKIFNTNVKELI